jgi:CRP-like cAMP-binding protein
VRRCDEASERLLCIERGWAVRARILPDGQRQILALLMPGDVCGLQAIVRAEHDHHIIALTDLEIAECPVGVFEDLIERHGALATLFLRGKVHEDSLLREHVVRLGRRKARERVLHLIIEICERQKLGGCNTPWTLAYSLNRETLADALGLSPVHVSRSLAALSRIGVIGHDEGRLSLKDRETAAALCGYERSYLHAAPAS